MIDFCCCCFLFVWRRTKITKLYISNNNYVLNLFNSVISFFLSYVILLRKREREREVTKRCLQSKRKKNMELILIFNFSLFLSLFLFHISITNKMIDFRFGCCCLIRKGIEIKYIKWTNKREKSSKHRLMFLLNPLCTPFLSLHLALFAIKIKMEKIN